MRLQHLNLRVGDAGACRAFSEDHFGFRQFDADGGPFLQGPGGFLLALIPSDPPTDLPDGSHLGFAAAAPDEVAGCHRRLSSAGVRTSAVEDHGPAEDDVSFRCWDPNGTEVEVYWDGA